MLNEKTLTLADEIAKYDFFANIGLLSAAGYGTKCKTWENAVQHAQSSSWENHCQTFSNRILVYRERANLDRKRPWTDETAALVVKLLTPATTKINLFFKERNEGTGLGRHVTFQLISAVKEQEYCDILEPLFFVGVLLPIYRAGYYPCGWNGSKIPRSQLGGEIDKLPAGTPRVF